MDATVGHALLSFVDAFVGYHYIPLHESDQEKTAIINDKGLYCYKVMPFGLKNTGATYQRLVNKVFESLIRKNMEVYVDDMIVNSKEDNWHPTNLRATFALLWSHNTKLNPKKCVFAIQSGKFLVFMVSRRGTKANLDKV